MLVTSSAIWWRFVDL